MKKHGLKVFLLFTLSFFCLNILVAQEKGGGYKFTIQEKHKASSVKNQSASNTCWSFASVSLFESELLRLGKGEYDFSEMFIVRNTYAGKAKKYVRLHGNSTFAGGGAFNDATDVFKEFGLLPEEVYDGKRIGEKNHKHGEIDAVLKGYVDAVIKNRNRKLSPVWFEGFEGILDAYLGVVPETFLYDGKSYNAKSFAEELGINVNDYILISSFTHHPYYEKFIIEVPDNWAWGEVYNLPLDDFATVIESAINNGYTVAWAADVSDQGFSSKNGIAIIPEKDWSEMSDKEATGVFISPVKQSIITKEKRQEDFDNYSTTDDHAMHITGIAKDQLGTKYYLVKNSWGEDSGPYDGYFYVSEAYVLLKTTSIMLNKNAIPSDISEKLKL